MGRRIQIVSLIVVLLLLVPFDFLELLVALKSDHKVQAFGFLSGLVSATLLAFQSLWKALHSRSRYQTAASK